MKCPKCNSKMFVFVGFTIEMPVDDMYHVTKKKIQTKDYQIWSANWDAIRNYHCKKCGYREKV